MEQILVSIGYYVIVVTACEVARRIVEQTTSPGTTARLFLYELLGTLQVCTAVYENGLILKHYGVLGFFVTVAIMVTVHSLVNRGAVITPCGAFEKLFDGGFSLQRFLTHLTGQLSGGYLAFRAAKMVWRLGLCSDHVEMLKFFPCVLKFKAPFLIRCGYELIGNFLLRSAVGQAPPSRKRYVAALGTAIGLSIELTFLGPPGLNPIIASSRLLGCEGMSTQAHLVVYWLCPIIGWLLAANFEKQKTSTLAGKKSD